MNDQSLCHMMHHNCDLMEVVYSSELVCSRCNLMDFSSLDSLIVHYRNHHQSCKPQPDVDGRRSATHQLGQAANVVQQCDDCGNEFASINELSLHSCSSCSKVTSSGAAQTESHSDDRSSQMWQCSICLKSFSVQSTYRAHMKRSHPGEKEKDASAMSGKFASQMYHDQSTKQEKCDADCFLETNAAVHSDTSDNTVIEASFAQAAEVSDVVRLEEGVGQAGNNTEIRGCADKLMQDQLVMPALDSGAPLAAKASEHNARLRLKWQQKYPNRTIVPHECTTCGQQFMQAVQLRKHMIRHIEQESTTLAGQIEFPYTCCVCTRHFLFGNDLKRHLISHSDDRPHQCKVCQRQFKRDDDLAKHMKMHGDVRPYVCEVCSDSFESSSKLRKHVRRVHGNRFECSQCGQRFAKRSLLRYHNHVYHAESTGDNSSKPYICDRCGKGFTIESDLRTHLYASHARRRTPLHACRWCRRQFSSVSHLASHERTHTGDRPYTCDLCGKQFTQSGSLNVHKRTHTEPQPFACNQCGQKFASKQYAKKHMAMRHGIT